MEQETEEFKEIVYKDCRAPLKFINGIYHYGQVPKGFSTIAKAFEDFKFRIDTEKEQEHLKKLREIKRSGVPLKLRSFRYRREEKEYEDWLAL